MNGQINEMPLWGALIAYTLLALGIYFGGGFLISYVRHLPWRTSEQGVWLVISVGVIVAFFLLYTALVIWPMFPGRGWVRMILFAVLVGALGWLRRQLRRYLRKRHRSRSD